MFLPSYRRLFKNDFKPEEQPLIEKLSVTINNGFEILYEALNKKLDFTNNFQGTDVDIQVEVDANGIPKGNASFKLSNAQVRIKRIWVGSAKNLTNPGTYPLGAPFISFEQTSGSILIKHITGLQPNNVYLLNVLAT